MERNELQHMGRYDAEGPSQVAVITVTYRELQRGTYSSKAPVSAYRNTSGNPRLRFKLSRHASFLSTF